MADIETEGERLTEIDEDRQRGIETHIQAGTTREKEIKYGCIDFVNNFRKSYVSLSLYLYKHIFHVVLKKTLLNVCESLEAQQIGTNPDDDNIFLRSGYASPVDPLCDPTRAATPLRGFPLVLYLGSRV